MLRQGVRLDGLDWYQIKIWITHAPLDSYVSRVAATPEEWTRANWTLEVELLSAIEFRLHQLVYAQTEDAVKKINYPERILPPEILKPVMDIIDNEEEGKQTNVIGGQGVDIETMRKMLGWGPDAKPE